MGINRYMVPAEQKTFQTYVPQYVPLPIEDIAKYREFAEKKQQPITDLEGIAAEVDPWYSDVDAANQIEQDFNREAADLASRIDKFESPLQYEREATALKNKYAPMFKEITKRRQASAEAKKLVDKYGERALYTEEGRSLLEDSLYDRDPVTGARVKRDFNYTPRIEEAFKYRQEQEKYFDNMTLDKYIKPLRQSDIDGYLKYGTYSTNMKKLTDMLEPSVQQYLNSREGQQQMFSMTGKTNVNDFTEQDRAKAENIVRNDMLRAVLERKQYKEDERYMFDQVAAEERKAASGAGERELDYIPDAYTQTLDKASKGSGAKVTEKQGAYLLGQEPVKNEQTGFWDFTDNSYNKMVSVPEGDVLSYKEGLKDLETRGVYNDLEEDINEQLDILLGQGRNPNEEVGVDFTTSALEWRNIKKKYKTKENLRKAILNGAFDASLVGSPSPYRPGSGERIVGGTPSDFGVAAYSQLQKFLPEMKKLEDDINSRYKDKNEFLKATDEENDDVKKFRLGQKLSGINLPNVHLSTSKENTNVRTINGKVYLDVESAMTGKQLKQALRDNGVTDTDLELMREQGILKGEGEWWNISGTDVDDWGDIDDEKIYSFKYMSEHEPDENIRSNFSGSTHKDQHGKGLANYQIVNQQKQFSRYMGNNAFENRLTNEVLNAGPSEFVSTVLSNIDGVTAEDLADKQLKDRVQNIYKQKNQTKRFASIRDLIHDIRVSSSRRARQEKLGGNRDYKTNTSNIK